MGCWRELEDHALLCEVVEEFFQGGVAAQGGGRAHHEELVFSSRDGHVQPPPVLQQLTQIAFWVTPDKGNDDDALVAALVLVHSVDLHTAEGWPG